MFVVSVAALVGSIGALSFYGLNLGVDFKGGSVLELAFTGDRPPVESVQAELAKNEFVKDISVNPSGERGVIIRTGVLSEQEHQTLLGGLRKSFGEGLEEVRFDSVGPAVGQELRDKSIKAIIILLAAVLLYIAYMFRRLSRSLSLWAMAAGTILGLLHDIMIPMGVFAILGQVYGIQITAVFVAAVLTILGYTVSDKVVIYDRVRENILRGNRFPLPELVHQSVMQTLVRSINNTLVVMLSSLAVFLFGGESIRWFALALMVGIGLGAYSSIFVAAPVLVWLSARSGKGRA